MRTLFHTKKSTTGHQSTARVLPSLLLILILSECSQNKNHASHDQYTCPMHPQVVQNKPGACPICGMDLVKMGASASADDSALPSQLKPLNLRGYPTGTLAPEFSGRTLDARQLSVTDLRGKVILLNFWASWCAECRPEMPVLERLHRELAPPRVQAFRPRHRPRRLRQIPCSVRAW